MAAANPLLSLSLDGADSHAFLRCGGIAKHDVERIEGHFEINLLRPLEEDQKSFKPFENASE